MINCCSAGKYKTPINCGKISFDSIHSFRYVEQRFSIVPILIGGGVGAYFFSIGDFASFYFGTMPAFALGLGLSLLPKFSEELYLSNDGWSIKIN